MNSHRVANVWAGLFLILILVAGGAAHARNGDLDPTFGNGGTITVDLVGYASSARAVVLQPDGKIVIGGEGGYRFTLMRFNVNGSLDTSFGTNGVVRNLVDIYADAFAIALQKDGKIVGAGSPFAPARYNSDGSLDESFDARDNALTNLYGASEARAIAIQSDDKIITAGGFYNPWVNALLIARYNTDGSLDTGFGAGGFVTNGGATYAMSLALQSDGKIVIAGPAAASGFLVARLNTNGTFDASFGSNGVAITEFGYYESANALAIQPDGKIVVAGVGANRFALLRCNPDGSLDTGFGTGGKVTTPFFLENIETANGVAIQKNGKIVTVGQVFQSGDSKFAVARYTSNGRLDPSFGDCGILTTDFGNPNDPGLSCPPALTDCSDDIANAVAVQPDGSIVVVGGAGACIPTCYFAVSRYLGEPTTGNDQPPVALAKDVIVPVGSNCVADAAIDAGSFDPDNGDAITIVQCPPGPYPLGTNIVALGVTDSHNATSNSTARVIVVDNTPPSITCPADTSVPMSSPLGETVNYAAPVTSDLCSVTVTSVPPSGSLFPAGDTTVLCTATDTAGNQSSCSFVVHIKDVSEQITDAIARLQTLGIDPKLVVKFTKKLQNAGKQVTAGKPIKACKQLVQLFKQILKLNKAGKLTEMQAEAMATDGLTMYSALSCSRE